MRLNPCCLKATWSRQATISDEPVTKSFDFADPWGLEYTHAPIVGLVVRELSRHSEQFQMNNKNHRLPLSPSGSFFE